MSFQERFIQAKEMRNLRWIDIANKSGLDKAQISMYKNGKHLPEQDALYKLASALNVSVEWLMDKDSSLTDDTSMLRMYNQLNDVGKAKLMDYLNNLLSDDNYKR